MRRAGREFTTGWKAAHDLRIADPTSLARSCPNFLLPLCTIFY